MRGWPRSAIVALLLCAGSTPATAGEGPEFQPYEEVPQLLTVLAPVLLPKVLADTWLLRDFVRSGEFRAVRERWGDRYAVDAIFDTAVRLCWNNKGLALLLSCLATLDHRRVGINLPVLGPLIWIPLTSEFDDEFQERVDNLPRAIYSDSPPGMGDSDKLQHFFGSAFLTYVSESREAAQRVGTFVEWGEERFIVDGAVDERDLRANLQGQMFGLALLAEPQSRPSTFLVSALAWPAVPGPDSVVVPLRAEER